MIDKITLHHSLTQDSGTVSWNAIWEYHVNYHGWSTIGYHYGIELIGNRYNILIGRMPNEKGAHVRMKNTGNIGICLIGNFTSAKPPGGQWNKALELVRFLLEEYHLLPDNVYGHYELDANRTCPGRMFMVDDFRRAI